MKKSLLFFSCVALSGVLHAGGRSGETNIQDLYYSEQALTVAKVFAESTALAETTTAACGVTEINPLGHSMVFTRQNLDSTQTEVFEGAFSLERTLQQIVDTSNGGENSQLENMMQSMLDTFLLDEKDNQGVIMDITVRSAEASLSASALIASEMQPTAVFNRFDLAAADGSHCGEYRIVYHRNAPRFGPFFLIFEAQYPNPQPESGVAGCLPIADFWASLDQTDADSAMGKLEDFYFNGITEGGVELPAVVDFAHYTFGSGQVRSNHFVTFPWQLREFRTVVEAGETEFAIDTVKNNPLPELFRLEADQGLRDDFVLDFPGLTPQIVPESRGITNPNAIINAIFLDNQDKYNEFQSDSDFADDAARAGTGSDGIDGEILTALINNLPGDGTTPTMLMNRVEAMSCGGCHHNSNNDEIAPGVFWPDASTNGPFFHVATSGSLSGALTESFLPSRAAVLDNFVCNTPRPINDMGLEFINETSAKLFHVDQGYTAGFNFLCLNGECISGQLVNGRYERTVDNLTLGDSYQVFFKVQDDNNPAGQCISSQTPVVFTNGTSSVNSDCAN